MSCSRRNFLKNSSLLIFATGTLGSAVLAAKSEAKQGNIKYAMVHDEVACIGCNACVSACREVNHVPEGVTRLKIERTKVGQYPEAKYGFTRISCEHCENAPCVYVCPTGAAYKDKKTGIVDVHKDRCVGCGYCLAACPYQVRYFNPVNKSADKCNFCRDTNLAKGKQPACVEVCPTKALTFGDLNDPSSNVAKKITQNAVYRDKAYLGTKPQLYKIPHQYGEIEK